jgi:adenylate cyclase
MVSPSDTGPTQTAPVHGGPPHPAILFADIVGSTRLYETLGDTHAKGLIDECIGTMRDVVERYGGRVVKTIGDEVMCVLPNADSACLAATDMQLKISSMAESSGVKRAIRAGFHAGPVIEDDNDVFGDSVNIAARMAGLAKAMQIITTQATVQQLSLLLQSSTRRIAALTIKGKGDDIDVCEVIWQAGDELTMATPSINRQSAASRLSLAYAGTEMVLEQTSPGIVLGRDPACQIVVTDRMASRQHARIERRRGKFFLIDQSTNGTFVTFEGEEEIALRREELMLRGKGLIAFGRQAGEATQDVATFSVAG